MNYSYLLRILLPFVIFFLFAFNGFGQEDTYSIIYEEEVVREQCLSQEDYEIIVFTAKNNIRKFGHRMSNNRSNLVLFDWPMRQAALFNDPSYHDHNNFVDNNPVAGQTLDYNCGNKTYDGHNGSDYGIWPFTWNKVANNEVEVIAAAAGMIIEKRDGYFDKNCNCDGNPPSNLIVIEHSDGKKTMYVHLKKNSLLIKNVGDEVQAGEYLGIVSSSGCSSGPHLHFEVRDANWQVLDPYQGNCNSTSLWKVQKPYNDTKIMKLMTNDKSPEFSDCPNEDVINEQDTFQPNSLAYFGGYFYAIQNGQTMKYQIIQPNGEIWKKWDHLYQDNPTLYAFWYSAYFLPNITGRWAFQVTLEGITESIPFYVFSENENCVSHLILNENVESGIYQSSGNIYSEGIITNNSIVEYEAKNNIELSAGFHAQQGCDFLATIKDCTTNSSLLTFSRTEKPTLSTFEDNKVIVYPNPFIHTTTIDYQLAESGQVTISLFDISGKELQQLTDAYQEKGVHQLKLNSENLEAGLYFIHANLKGVVRVEKLYLVTTKK